MSDVVALLRQLVAIDSTNPPGNEIRVATALRDWFRARGLEASIDEFEPGRANLVVRVDGGQPGPSIMFNTHMDVVPAGEGWSREPFAAALEDGVVHGRGAADSKGSLAAMAVAVAELAGDAGALSGAVLLSAVADEELNSRGARRLVESVTADGVVVGEPTELRLMSAHKGSVRPVVEVRGLSAHAALPERGRNALEVAAALLARLPNLRRVLARSEHPLVGRPTIVPVLGQGGEAPNMVPRSCRITFDRRLVPGETEEDALEQIRSWLADFEADCDGITAEIVDLAPSTGGPSETPGDHPFVAACRDGLSDAGLPSDLCGLIVNCDMTHFRGAGIPTVICGPGSPDAMHVRDEALAVPALERAVDVYLAMARRWCGSGS